MTAEFYIKYIFILQIKKISESKKNKSINEKYFVCYCNKTALFSCRKLRIIWKIKSFASLINGDSLTFSLFLVAVNVDSKDELKNWRNPSVMTSACFPDNLSAFFFFLFRCGKPKITGFVLSFFFTLYIFSLKITTKNVRDLPFFLSFFLSFFFSWIFSLTITTKNDRDLTFLSFFLSFFFT